METISRSMTSINTSFARCSCTNIDITCIHIHTHTHPFNGPMSGTTRVSRYQKGKTSLDFTGARDSEWQWHQLGHMQVCISLQTDNHASTAPLSFLQTGCPSCRPTNSVKALVGLYQKKHSPTHTHPDHQTSFINFFHLLWSIASSFFNFSAWQSLPQPHSRSSLVFLLLRKKYLLFSKTPACTDLFSHKSTEVLRLTENECIRLETNEAADKCEQWKITSTVLVQTTELNKSSNNTHTNIPPWAHN